MKIRFLPSVLAVRQRWGTSWVLPSAIMVIVALVFGAPTRSQAPPPTARSMVDVARSAREQQSNSTKRAKVITDDDLAPQPSLPTTAEIPAESSSSKTAEVPKAENADCNNANAERLKAELQAAQEEQDQLRSDLAYQPKIISDNDVDMTNFKPGSSGIDTGATALTQAQPVAPARVTEVMVNEKVASLKDSIRVACGPPKEAGAERKLDSAEQQLKLLQQEFALDREAYYSKPDYSRDTPGKEKLDAEQQQIEALKAEIERLKDELGAPKAN